ncbi:cytochrome c oxidase subunit II [Natronococcus wangiae]|uniref:cytochrome c oxidase subunit II n=1 Tax=Natronococcus wangiae TaxID=3068275 RepID=UPI00273DF8DA|nr:cytochrome c oxidase subunit II [Natronococcus sp. AD5]
MNGRRSTFSALVVGTIAGLLALTGTVAAQSRNRNLIEGLNYQLLYVALPLSLFVLMILIYAAIKFHDNDDPQPTAEDPALEITWTAATAIILLFVGISGYSVLVSPYVSPPQPAEVAGGGGPADEEYASVDDLPETDDEELIVRGYQWGWEATYPNANVTTQDEIVIPVDENVTMWLTTEDVIHSLFISDFGAKQDAYPGEYTRLRTVAYETGQYDATCTEFCGAGHSRMSAEVTVVDRQTYDEWLEENEGELATAPDAP